MSLQWEVNRLEVIPTYNGFNNVVYKVYFTITEDTRGLSTSGSVRVPLPAQGDPNFIEFENLTKQDVAGMVVDKLKEAGVTRQQFLSRVQNRLANGITDLSSPGATNYVDPPWETP